MMFAGFRGLHLLLQSTNIRNFTQQSISGVLGEGNWVREEDFEGETKVFSQFYFMFHTMHSFDLQRPLDFDGRRINRV